MVKEKYFQINAIVNSFKILELLTLRDEWELSELVKASGFPKTTVHRILLNLEELGYASRIYDSHRYAPTTKMFELGCAIIEKKNVLRVARPIMEKISSETGETIVLAIRDDIHMIQVDKIDSYHYTFKDDTGLGGRFLTYCSASGKAVLSHLDNDQIIKLFKDHKFEKFTEKTIGGLEELFEHLERTRKQGYGIETEEYALGLRCLGACILDHEGKPIASLAIAAPLNRLTDTVVLDKGPKLVQGAETISLLMGYQAANKEKSHSK